eukprot:CAMPEP_0174262010 /NCGR_PEP_ID=MMETSP0439-20130205/12719_1 /TAXON_ID=0 /ORGANISM="Stereomyxa ramosa, Strain Chinc5" /LENGTH=530 /DNA_ID=CAMNT_0015346639 /DNA_START=71 /DNA_END=1660 /DNA_ORIENTATION=-
MAAYVAEGAKQIASIEVRLLSCDEAVAEDVLWADGLAVGSPTNLGGISWKMKQWWDELMAEDYWCKIDGKVCCTFSSAGGHGGGAELACQAMANVLLNFGFLYFGVTDYVSPINTLHYGAVVAKAPRAEVDAAACRRLGLRLSEWVAVFFDHINPLHPLLNSKAKKTEDEAELPGGFVDPEDLLQPVFVVVNKNVPEESQEEWLEMAKQLSEESRKEDGCISYSFVSMKESKTHFYIVEKWASKAHLETHFETPHFKSLVPKMDAISETIAVDICEPALHAEKYLPKLQSAPPKSLNILIFTRALDYVHGSTPAAAAFLHSVCTKWGWKATISDDNTLLEGDKDSDFDAIVLLNNSGECFDPNNEILTRHIEAGKGVLGCHAALASFLSGKDSVGGTKMDSTCPIIEDVFGCHFLNHPPPQNGIVRVDKEAITKFKRLCSLPPSFTHHDEFFNFNKNPCEVEGLTPLLFVDEETYEGGLMGEEHPVVWYRTLGEKEAPVFYCALGHFSSFYNNQGPAHVQTILKEGLRFV